MKNHDNCVTPLQIQSMANALYNNFISIQKSSSIDSSLLRFQTSVELALLRKLVEITSQDFETIELIIGYLKELKADGVGRPLAQSSGALGQGGN